MNKFFKVSAQFFLLVLFFSSVLVSSACTRRNNNRLNDYLTELRSDIFEGSSENYHIKAAYGFKESPFANDGIIGNRVYSLSFLLVDKEPDDVGRKIVFTFNEEEYRLDLKLNPLTDSITAVTEINDFNVKSFSIKIIAASETEEITLYSVVPDSAIGHERALEILVEKQSALIDVYKNDSGVFIGEISERIIVKKDKPYWYIGLLNGKGGTKALLIDGLNGEILAVREII